MDVEIENLKDTNLQIQLATLQLVVTLMESIVDAKQKAIATILDERGFRFGAEAEVEMLRLELRGIRQAEDAAVKLFKDTAKKANYETMELNHAPSRH